MVDALAAVAPLAVVVAGTDVPNRDGASCCCGPLNGKPLAMVKSSGQVDDAHVEGVRRSPALC